MKKSPYSPGIKRKSMIDDVPKTNSKPGLSSRRSITFKPPSNLVLTPFNNAKNVNDIMEDY